MCIIGNATTHFWAFCIWMGNCPSMEFSAVKSKFHLSFDF